MQKNRLNHIDTKTDYKRRLTHVLNYIEENLDSHLSLKVISEVALFSPFHFHRIFKSLAGETLNEFITRKKVEKSAIDLIHSDLAITDITLKNGFSCNSTFTRTFRKFYGINPTRFREKNFNTFAKVRGINSKNSKTCTDTEEYLCTIDHIKKWTAMNAKIEIRKFQKMHLAYLSVMGPDKLRDAFQRLIKWAESKGCMTEDTKLMTIYHDSLKITDEHKARMSAGISLSRPIAADGEIALTTIEAGDFLVGSYEIELRDFEEAWTGHFIWMNDDGYKKRDANPFEVYHNNFNDHPEKKCIADFCIPIRKNNVLLN